MASIRDMAARVAHDDERVQLRTALTDATRAHRNAEEHHYGGAAASPRISPGTLVGLEADERGAMDVAYMNQLHDSVMRAAGFLSANQFDAWLQRLRERVAERRGGV